MRIAHSANVFVVSLACEFFFVRALFFRSRASSNRFCKQRTCSNQPPFHLRRLPLLINLPMSRSRAIVAWRWRDCMRRMRPGNLNAPPPPHNTTPVCWLPVAHDDRADAGACYNWIHKHNLRSFCLYVNKLYNFHDANICTLLLLLCVWLWVVHADCTLSICPSMLCSGPAPRAPLSTCTLGASVAIVTPQSV